MPRVPSPSLLDLFFTMSPSKLTSLSITTLFILFLADPAAAAASSACRKTCGAVSLRYPFGSGPGCGHPDFSRYIKCSAAGATESLQLATATGAYAIDSIDYAAATLAVADPLMSTCSSMQNSGSFGLDRASPLAVSDRNVFVLLGCSLTSPLFDPDQDLCHAGSASRLCRGLYSCKAVAGLGLPRYGPANTCCVYDSLAAMGSRSGSGSGSGYALDLPKLQCASYSSIYEFVDEGDPAKWRFGISLQYNDSYYTSECRDCEESQGVCGFSGLDRSFACICPNGVNSTVNCFGRGYALSGTMGLEVEIKMSIAGFALSLASLLLRSR